MLPIPLDRHATLCRFFPTLYRDLSTSSPQTLKVSLCRPRSRSCTRFSSLTQRSCSAPPLAASCHSHRRRSPLRSSSRQCCMSLTADSRNMGWQWAPVQRIGPRGPSHTAATPARRPPHLRCAPSAFRCPLSAGSLALVKSSSSLALNLSIKPFFEFQLTSWPGPYKSRCNWWGERPTEVCQQVWGKSQHLSLFYCLFFADAPEGCICMLIRYDYHSSPLSLWVCIPTKTLRNSVPPPDADLHLLAHDLIDLQTATQQSCNA